MPSALLDKEMIDHDDMDSGPARGCEARAAEPGIDRLTGLIRDRAKNLFITNQYFCAEAVLIALNSGLRGGLPRNMAARLASAFPEGWGECGCTCGSIYGGVLALGLFLTPDHPTAEEHRLARQFSRRLYEAFQWKCECNAGPAPESLKGRELMSHIDHCAEMTGAVAEKAAELILEQRPELAGNADLEFLEQMDTMISAGLKRLVQS